MHCSNKINIFFNLKVYVRTRYTCRKAHGVPSLTWDSELARKTEAWAKYLTLATENSPHSLRINIRKTQNWPHSTVSYSFIFCC